MRIKKGDKVIVIAGNDKGSSGEVLRVEPSKGKLAVDGIAVRKKAQRSQNVGGRMVQGGMIEFEALIDASNVMLVCPHTGKPTRIGIRRDEDGRRIRYSKQSGKDID